jgi:hypothetical protein
MRLDHGAVEQLVGMTPSARHVDKQARAERIGVLADPMDVTLPSPCRPGGLPDGP